MRETVERRDVFFRVIALALLICVAAVPGHSLAEPDYRGMMERIEALLSEAAADYRAGDADSAKDKVQRSYFEIFENLEGPIRVNVSAKKNIVLEGEFGDIRKLIIDGAPVETVEARLNAHIAAIWAVLPELEGGHVLEAEPAAGAATAPETAQAAPAEPQTVEPHWVSVTERIGALIDSAADAYEAGDPDKARDLITEAQFDGYKNSLLETVVRRYVSQAQDVAYNAEFRRISGLVDDGKPARMVRASGQVLVNDMQDVLPGLPLIEGTSVVEEAPQETGERNWRTVADNVLDEMRKAIALHQDGDTGKAVGAVQDAYFDVFEGSGMESTLGARDAGLMSRIEAHFSKLMGLMKSDASAGDLDAALATMSADLDAAVALLGSGSDTPWALFLYSLMIILREGFEAMLIVTAVITYLVKTGNRDKLGVVVNSVVVALALSVATAVLVKWVFQVSAASQEVLEGATMLLATVVLFSMSYWLISKAEAEKWMAYIKDTMARSLSSGSLKALWFVGFLAVYREGAETVLFYEALTANAETSAGLWAIVGGFALGCVGLAVIYLAFRLGAARLPIRPFFMVTSALLYYMAFVFAGKGVMELIEGKIIAPTLVPGMPEIPFIGLYPYLETLAPQAVLIAAALLALVAVGRRKPPHKEPATEASELKAS
ncbi:iron permease [Rhodobium orientis]|uniref:Iron permease n=1 Tax=Rhodobium orientis TaxID=34017 RepID=A0A327JJB2_9HYPH|nr:iron permease [Rhodobium orientis]RAI25985.1 iron permease [Rhodobium orientis]